MFNYLRRFFCGERGIRTPGTLIEFGSLANYWFKPLTHLSIETSINAYSAVLSFPESDAKLAPRKLLCKRFGDFFDG